MRQFRTAPRQVAPSGGTAGDRAPGAAARRAAQSLRIAEEAFYDESQRIAQLSHPLLSQHPQGAAIRYEDPLLELLAKAGAPAPLAYAVVSVRRNEIQDTITVKGKGGVNAWMKDASKFQPYLVDSAGRDDVQGENRTQRNSVILRDVAYVISRNHVC